MTSCPNGVRRSFYLLFEERWVSLHRNPMSVIHRLRRRYGPGVATINSLYWRGYSKSEVQIEVFRRSEASLVKVSTLRHQERDGTFRMAQILGFPHREKDYVKRNVSDPRIQPIADQEAHSTDQNQNSITLMQIMPTVETTYKAISNKNQLGRSEILLVGGGLIGIQNVVAKEAPDIVGNIAKNQNVGAVESQ